MLHNYILVINNISIVLQNIILIVL